MSRAVRFTRTGGPDVLEFTEIGELHAEPGQVRVAVRAAGMNPYDGKVRSGLIPTTLPSGQGAEFAGVVDETGDGVDPALLGAEVLGWATARAQADYVVVGANRIAPKPSNLDWAAAGGVGLVANTAARAIAALELTSADTVLVTGASGAVGIIASQFALRAGATVVGTARESDHDLLRAIGVIPVAYGPEEETALRATAPEFTAALDTAGRPGVLSALALGIAADRIDSVADYAGGRELGIKTIGGGGKTVEQLSEFASDLAAGKLVLPVQITFPFDRVVEAYRYFESEHVVGKVVLVAA